jgi:hypothetical protein
MRVKCDAVTAAGNPCNNWAVGEANGRNYCHLKPHKAQIEAMAVRKDEEEDEAPEPEAAKAAEALPEPVVPVVEIDPDDIPEVELELEPEVEPELEAEPDPEPEPEPVEPPPWMSEPNAALRYRAKKAWQKKEAALAAQEE